MKGQILPKVKQLEYLPRISSQEDFTWERDEKRKKTSQFSGQEELIPENLEGMSTALVTFPLVFMSGGRSENNLDSGSVLSPPNLVTKKIHFSEVSS